jgi:hypothetical protein
MAPGNARRCAADGRKGAGDTIAKAPYLRTQEQRYLGSDRSTGGVLVTTGLSTQQRTEILDREVRNYVKKGYRVVSRSDTTAQLVRPKKFSLLIALICFVLAVVPFVLYLLWYMASRDKTVYLEVDTNGKIRRT